MFDKSISIGKKGVKKKTPDKILPAKAADNFLFTVMLWVSAALLVLFGYKREQKDQWESHHK